MDPSNSTVASVGGRVPTPTCAEIGVVLSENIAKNISAIIDCFCMIVCCLRRVVTGITLNKYNKYRNYDLSPLNKIVNLPHEIIPNRIIIGFLQLVQCPGVRAHIGF